MIETWWFENSTIVSMLFSYANIYLKAVTLYHIVLIFNIFLTFKIYYECIVFFVNYKRKWESTRVNENITRVNENVLYKIQNI